MRLLEIFYGQTHTVINILGAKLKFDKISVSKRKLYRKAKFVGENLTVNDAVEVNENTIIHDNVVLNGLKIHGSGNAVIGNYVQIGVDCLMITSNHNYEGELIPYDEVNIKKDIIVDDFVWIGSRCTILPGTHIGEGAIIQAGSVVHGEIPKCAIAGGNPAKIFKYRDIEHYDKLKAENKFYKHSS